MKSQKSKHEKYPVYFAKYLFQAACSECSTTMQQIPPGFTLACSLSVRLVIWLLKDVFSIFILTNSCTLACISSSLGCISSRSLRTFPKSHFWWSSSRRVRFKADSRSSFSICSLLKSSHFSHACSNFLPHNISSKTEHVFNQKTKIYKVQT